MTTPTLAIYANELSVTFGGVRAVDSVSFSVEQGAMFGVIGPNGAGKTSLLNAISRLVPVSHGELSILNHDGLEMHPAGVAKLGVSRSFQLAESFAGLTIRDYVALGCRQVPKVSLLASTIRSRAMRRAEAHLDEIILEELELHGLGKLASHTKMGDLSYGTRKRVDLARATVGRPRLVLLDEPTSGVGEVDIVDTAQVLSHVHAQRGTTIVVVDHRVDFIRRLCSTVLVMSQGAAIALGDTEAALENEAVAEAFLGVRRESELGQEV